MTVKLTTRRCQKCGEDKTVYANFLRLKAGKFSQICQECRHKHIVRIRSVNILGERVETVPDMCAGIAIFNPGGWGETVGR